VWHVYTIFIDWSFKKYDSCNNLTGAKSTRVLIRSNIICAGAVHKRSSLSYRFICGSTLLASIVLGNIYSGIYTSILAVPRFQVTITSIEDVAANPKIKLYVFKDTPTDNYIKVDITIYFITFKKYKIIN